MNKSDFCNKAEIRKSVLDIFLGLVKFDTQSDEESSSFPSTKSQIEFAQYLGEMCKTIGLKDVDVDKFGYVYATLPANIEESADIPTIGFISHMDTSPDCSGKDIKPNITEKYDGKDIKLKNNVVISPKEFPALENYIGQDIVTADGTTLLGADDKAGIAEILLAMKILTENENDIKHGEIKICFTPDEEIGKGADNFNVDKFGCKYAYTIDGGEIGELNYETFNAARAIIDITGKSVHPGSGKNIMKNASLIAAEFVGLLPNNETPANTTGREGFYHLTSVKGNVEKARLNYIIRDFDRNKFQNRKQNMLDAAEKIKKLFGDCINISIRDEYYNMFEIIKKDMEPVIRAENAMKAVEIEPNIQPVRGGTDGSRLSFMGLPCPNIFAGGHNFHGPFEFIPVQSMVAAVLVIVNIAKIEK